MSTYDRDDKIALTVIILPTLFLILGIIGEIKCIYKMCKCNWDPVGKAEIFYTAGSLTGTGAIIGWFDITDN